MKIIRIAFFVMIVAALSLGACSFLASDSGDSQAEAGESAPESAAVNEVEAPADTGQDSAPAADAASGEPASATAAIFDTDRMEEQLAQLVIRNEDLPHDYRLPPGGETNLAASTLINQMGEMQAKKYISATGRVTGWKIALERVKKEDFAPYTIENAIELFETPEGAQLALSSEWYPAYHDGRELKWVDGGCSIGDQCIFYYTEKFDAASQLNTQTYEMAFTYRNTLVWVMGRGLEVNISPEYILNVAQAALQKLEQYAQSQ